MRDEKVQLRCMSLDPASTTEELLATWPTNNQNAIACDFIL